MNVIMWKWRGENTFNQEYVFEKARELSVRLGQYAEQSAKKHDRVVHLDGLIQKIIITF